jgi:predicted flap endonuclease-1-like 5' DNA nuclease
MDKNVSEREVRRQREQRAPDDLRAAVAELFAAGRDVGMLSLQTAEQQLDAAIRLSERLRDDLVGTARRQGPQREEDLLGRLRRDAHRVVDVVADFGDHLWGVATSKGSQETALASSVRTVEGIGERYAARLADAGIHRCAELLEAGAVRQGREALAARSGISAKQLLTWINHVDLFRIRGVGEEYAGLLEKAGVDSVVELAQRNPGALHAKLREVNEAAGGVRRLPSPAQVAEWVHQAGTLPRVVTH